MFKLITNSSIHNLKSKLTFVYFLNALDIVFTFVLLKTGLFYEANTLMTGVVTNALTSIAIKIVIPALLILYIIHKLDDPVQPNSKLCNFFICLVMFVYLIINSLHIFYIFAYIL